MQRTKIKYLILFLGMMVTSTYSQSKDFSILFCYGDLFPEQVKGYDLVVLEPIHFSTEDVALFKKNNKKVLAYISLGEVNESARHYPEIKDYTLSKNEIWNSYVIDIANEKTRETLLSLIERHIQLKGFDGIFIDNIDNYTKWGPTPEKLPELQSFLGKVKNTFPKSYILQNAGLLVLEQTQPFIDAVAVESVATNYNFKTNHYRVRNKKEFGTQLAEIQSLKKNFKIPFYLIEYATTKKDYREIDKRLKNSGLPYFVGTIELQTVPKLK